MIKQNKIILSLIVICLLIRLPIILTYKPYIFPDTGGYEILASQIWHFDFSGYDGTRTPIYPLLLLISGMNYYTVWIFQSILGIIISIMLYDIALKLKHSIIISFIIGISYSCSLNLILFEANILTETLATFFIILSLWIFVRWSVTLPKSRGDQYSFFILMGILLGVGTLTRPVLFISIPIYLILFIYHLANNNESVINRIKKLSAFILPSVLIVLGWMIFNKITVNYFGITTLTGYNLSNHSGGFIEYADDKYAPIKNVYLKYRNEQNNKRGGYDGGTIWQALPEMRKATGLSYVDLSSELTKLSINLFIKYPDLYAMNIIRAWMRFWKNLFYWSPESIRLNFIKELFVIIKNIQNYILLIMKFIFLVFALKELYSIITNKKIENEFNFLVICIVLSGSIIQALLEYGENARYSIPFQPIIVMLVISLIIDWYKKRKLMLLTNRL